MAPIPIDPRVRFEAKIDRSGPSGCWLWTAACHPAGHGIFKVSRQAGHAYAHRYAYELYVGPIPRGLVLDHLCRVRNCVNPDHLEPVAQTENMRRSRRAGCPHSERATWVELIDLTTKRSLLRGEFCSYDCVADAVRALECRPKPLEAV